MTGHPMGVVEFPDRLLDPGETEPDASSGEFLAQVQQPFEAGDVDEIDRTGIDHDVFDRCC